MAKIVVVTSGKGGVGKTTTSASFATGLALRGHKTVVIDFDVGLRNLDLIMGCERRVVYDFVNVINNEARLQQALIRDKDIENLYILPASQTRDKDALSDEGVARVIDELSQEFDYIICDSPAGIESGFEHSIFLADRALIVSTPDVVAHFDAAYNDCSIRYGDLKKQLAEDIIAYTSPIRERIIEILKDEAYLAKVAQMGAEKARESAAATLKEVKELIGFKRLF